MTHPKIVGRKDTRISNWVVLVEKTVQFEDGADLQTYHCLTQQPYVGMLARTADGLIPLVRQYRPAVEQYTWEFPAGTLEPGESPLDAARRELLEETGLEGLEFVYLGSNFPDTGRLMVDSHMFYIRCGPSRREFDASEENLAIRYVSTRELKHMIVTGEFRHQLHVAIYGAALAHGIDLERV